MPWHRRGQALLFVLFLLLSIGLVTLALAGIWRSEIRARTLNRNGLLAFYLAQAAIEHAKAELAVSENWSTVINEVTAGLAVYSLGEGTYQIQPVQPIPCPGGFRTCRAIDSSGTVRSATRRITLNVALKRPNGTPDPRQLPNAWKEE